TGFSVKRGFSGAPAMDELGNPVWGMIATVDAGGQKVSFAITADDLRAALSTAGAQSLTGVRVADQADVDARNAMKALREQIAGMELETKQSEEEIARLQQMVCSFEQRERVTSRISAEHVALQLLAVEVERPAEGLLRKHIG